MNNRPSSPWPCPYCSRCFSTQEDIRNHLELRFRNALPELLKVLSNAACYPTHNAVRVPRTSERELDETLGDSIEDETETESESEIETETETHTGKKNRLRCPHQECKRKKASFSKKNNMMRHYHGYALVDIVFKLMDLNIVEFAIAHIGDIIWDPSPFENLVLSEKEKNIIRALAESQKIKTDKPFDDFIKGKGQGLVILLQYDFYVLFLRLNSADSYTSHLWRLSLEEDRLGESQLALSCL
ncbi:hypothetical protein GP486_002200 [Trichoglossum hirsutum]|uniref:Uncharacterized protein n=1 Tax=Trichoglossum hirsutum TaxID=265104 RepID=A0A9P8LF86_9PEZI|nr:hypothetical protein GP486_002200 [Trichoglossum hirsutum]